MTRHPRGGQGGSNSILANKDRNSEVSGPISEFSDFLLDPPRQCDILAIDDTFTQPGENDVESRYPRRPRPQEGSQTRLEFSQGLPPAAHPVTHLQRTPRLQIRERDDQVPRHLRSRFPRNPLANLGDNHDRCHHSQGVRPVLFRQC